MSVASVGAWERGDTEVSWSLPSAGRRAHRAKDVWREAREFGAAPPPAPRLPFWDALGLEWSFYDLFRLGEWTHPRASLSIA